jgi:hypothetical protein
MSDRHERIGISPVFWAVTAQRWPPPPPKTDMPDVHPPRPGNTSAMKKSANSARRSQVSVLICFEEAGGRSEGWPAKFSQECATSGHRTFHVLAETDDPRKHPPERCRQNSEEDDNMMKRDAQAAAPDGWMPRVLQTTPPGGQPFRSETERHLADSIVYLCALLADRPRLIDRYIDYFGETPRCARDADTGSHAKQAPARTTRDSFRVISCGQ